MDELRRRALQREELEKEAAREQDDSPAAEEDFLEVEDPLLEIPVGDKHYDKRKSVLRRTTSEAALGFFVHLCLLIYCTGVNVYDSTAYKKCKEKDLAYDGHDNFGWRFKYLTFLTMVCTCIIVCIMYKEILEGVKCGEFSILIAIRQNKNMRF